MAVEARTTWGGSLHTTFRLFPEPLGHLGPMLAADGKTPDEVLATLPFDSSRSKNAGSTPDPRRYRDYRQVYEVAGLLFEGDDGIVHVTDLGRATQRWVGKLTPKNLLILGRHAAYALSACQLRNPIGSQYDPSMYVFPFAFIWRAMLELDNRISSDELNRALFKVSKESELGAAIKSIADARSANDLELMGEETITGERKDDRIIPWLSIASFGWILIQSKQEGGQSGFYTISPACASLLKEAASIRHSHRQFATRGEYVTHVSDAAALPPDLR